LILNRIVRCSIGASSKDPKRRVVKVEASYMGLDGEHRETFEFDHTIRFRNARAKVPNTIETSTGEIFEKPFG